MNTDHLSPALSTFDWLTPDWPCPETVKAIVTTRNGGQSEAPYAHFNLAMHVDDDAQQVAHHREQLTRALGISNLVWGQQVHGITVCNLPLAQEQAESLQCDPQKPQADAFYTDQPGQPCLVMTADCLPVMFCDQAGRQVAVAHAGWRGLVDGILEQTVAAFDGDSTIMAWLGPAISQQAFEVGDEVRQRFLAQAGASGQAAVAGAFQPSARAGHWYADLYALAKLRLQAVGVTDVYGGEYCTYQDAERFYSYRRDGQTGRMVSIIWLDAASS